MSFTLIADVLYRNRQASNFWSTSQDVLVQTRDLYVGSILRVRALLLIQIESAWIVGFGCSTSLRFL